MNYLNRIYGRRVALGIALTLIGSGCSTLKIEKAEVESTRKVALVGFSLQQKVPNTVTGMVGDALSGSSSEPTGSFGSGAVTISTSLAAEAAPHAEEMYDGLVTTLRKEMKMEVVSRRELSTHPAYAKLYRKMTEGWQPLRQAPPKTAAYLADGVLEEHQIHRLKPSEREELMTALGVDAIAVAQLRVELEEKGGAMTLIGGGRYHPQSKLVFRLFKRGKSDAIWMDLAADGDPTESGAEHGLGIADERKLDRLAVGATTSAYQHLIRRYRGYN